MIPSYQAARRRCSFVLGMSRVIFSGPSFVSRTSIGKLFDMDGAEGVRLHDLFGNKDGILVVVAVPWHERAQEVYAERELDP